MERLGDAPKRTSPKEKILQSQSFSLRWGPSEERDVLGAMGRWNFPLGDCQQGCILEKTALPLGRRRSVPRCTARWASSPSVRVSSHPPLVARPPSCAQTVQHRSWTS